MKYFDSHCHMNMKPLLEEQTKIFAELKELEFGINIVGYDIESSLIAVEQAKNENVYATIGVHPCDIGKDLSSAKDKLEKMILSSSKIIALGETGFDFFHTKESPQLYFEQLEWLNMHYELAKKYNLVLMMHVRDGHKQMLEWIREHRYEKIIIHCFNQPYETAKEYLELGCYLSIPGVITYKNAGLLQDAIQRISLEQIIVETDSPFLSPVPHRGRTNYPQYTLEVLKKIADLKSMDIKDISETILKNTKRIFNI